MTEFLMVNVLNLLGVASVATLIYVLVKWPWLPVLQRLVGLQFFFVFLHVMEESRSRAASWRWFRQSSISLPPTRISVISYCQPSCW